MILPDELQTAIDSVFHEVSLREITRHARSVRERYRRPPTDGGRLIQSQEELLGYAGSRIPATYGAVHAVLSALRDLEPGFQPRTVLDVGAGPAGGAWAVTELWPGIERIDLIERDPRMIALGERMLAQSRRPALKRARYERCDLTREWRGDPHDLVIASYVIREIREDQRAAFVDRAWNATGRTLCCIEPSKSPRGYEIIRAVRDRLADVHRASVVAPCVQLAGCPTRKGQWCHFGQRVERSRTHRRLKDGWRSYEDEKFSYVIAAREPGPSCLRVAFPPRRTGAGVLLDICTGVALHRVLVRKRDKERYGWARRARWGDCVPSHVAALVHATDPVNE
jgi:ribosomal protein RSM22 (predicted rRNA methylase)